MDNIRRGDRSLIKDLNKALVIDQVRRNGPISRKEIADNTSLGASTVTYIVESLIKDNYLFEVGSGVSTGGRKPILLQFNANRSYVIAVKIEERNLVFGKLNLNGEIVIKETIPFKRNASVNIVKKILRDKIVEWMKVDPGVECSGIGIAVSGLINQEEKKVIFTPILLWKDVSFQDLEDDLGVPVYIENDANAFALAELWLKRIPYENFVCVTVGAGIGSGIVVKNEIYRGEWGGAGELGHTVVHRDGLPCYCGQIGCLEAHTSDTYILNQAIEILDNPTLTLDDVVKEAEKGNESILSLYQQVGEDLGLAIRNMVNLLHPSVIIMGGEGLRAKEFILPMIIDQLNHTFFSPHLGPTEVILTDLSIDKWLIGVGSLVIQDLFREPLYREVSSS